MIAALLAAAPIQIQLVQPATNPIPWWVNQIVSIGFLCVLLFFARRGNPLLDSGNAIEEHPCIRRWITVPMFCIGIGTLMMAFNPLLTERATCVQVASFLIRLGLFVGGLAVIVALKMPPCKCLPPKPTDSSDLFPVLPSDGPA